MNGKKTILVAGVMLIVLILPSVSDMAFAQYLPSKGQTGFDDYIVLAEKRVTIANENPSTGSGTPLFAADGVLGAILLSTGVFGGIAVAFFVRGRHGKYAEMGRG